MFQSKAGKWGTPGHTSLVRANSPRCPKITFRSSKEGISTKTGAPKHRFCRFWQPSVRRQGPATPTGIEHLAKMRFARPHGQAQIPLGPRVGQ